MHGDVTDSRQTTISASGGTILFKDIPVGSTVYFTAALFSEDSAEAPLYTGETEKIVVEEGETEVQLVLKKVQTSSNDEITDDEEEADEIEDKENELDEDEEEEEDEGTVIYVSEGANGSNAAGDGTESSPYSTLAEAIGKINGLADSTAVYTIKVSGEITGTTAIYSLSAAKLTITGATGKSTDILNGSNAGCVFMVDVSNSGDSVPITLKNLKITGGSGTDYGGGISNVGGNLTVTGCTITGNTTQASGGGIYNDQGTLTVANCEISSNIGYSGGGVYSRDSTLTLSGCTITYNSANDYGGGLYLYNAATLENCTITENSVSTSGGGGLYVGGFTVTCTGTTISGNTVNGTEENVYLDAATLVYNGTTYTPDNTSSVLTPF